MAKKKLTGPKVPPIKLKGTEVFEHGQDDFSAMHLENSIYPTNLTEKGVKYAEEVGKRAAKAGKKNIISSTVQRAEQTADIASAMGKQLQHYDTPVLNTWNIGVYNGAPEGSFNEVQWARNPDAAPEGGESFNDFASRMEEAYEFAKDAPKDDELIAHSKVTRALEALNSTKGKWTPKTTEKFLNQKEENKAKNGGWLDKYQDGGETQDTTNNITAIAKATKATLPSLPIYYGPQKFENCVGAGCSKIATTEAANLYGVSYDALNPQDAWYKRSAVLKNKGKEVWNPSMGKNYSGIKIGDFVSLDRAGNPHAKDVSKIPGYSLADNEGNEHLGTVIGINKEGIPLVKHGSEHGKIYVQPINNLFLPDAGPITLTYTPQSIYRAAALENAELKDQKFYRKPEKTIPMKWSNPNRKPTENEQKYLNAINTNAGKQQLLYGLSPAETNLINSVSYGIFHNESEAGESKTPIGGKMLAASLAHAFGRDSSPSLGDVQVKYDDLMYNKDKSLSSIGKKMQDIGVDRGGLYSVTEHRKDYNDEVNAVSAVLSDALEKFKKNPKYKYNAKDNTVYGDIPLEQALATIYKNGPSAFKESVLRKRESYGKAAMNHLSDLRKSTIPDNIKLIKGNPLFEDSQKVAKKENGGWLQKYNDGGPVQENYNDYSMSAPEGFVGSGTFNKGRDYSPAWGGQFAMGGSMPGAVGFMYARTAGAAPSNGPYAKKTKPSAENGTEMRFYQEGLDFKPKTISEDGISLDFLDYPQKKAMELLTGKEQKPSDWIKDKGYFNRDTPRDKAILFGADVIADPLNLLPIAKLKYLKGLTGLVPDALNSVRKVYNTGRKSAQYADNTSDLISSFEQGGQLEKLDQLTNFTNYNTKQPGGWLDKYEG